jgi:hypothetical protein
MRHVTVHRLTAETVKHPVTSTAISASVMFKFGTVNLAGGGGGGGGGFFFFFFIFFFINKN